jgi:hypothetical protein
MEKATIFFVVFFALTIVTIAQEFQGFDDEYDDSNSTEYQQDLRTTTTTDVIEKDKILNASQRLIEQQRLLDEEIGQIPTKDEKQEEIRIKLQHVEGKFI